MQRVNRPLYASGRTAVKFCGITNRRDAALALRAGADAIGVILAPSPRRVALRVAYELAAEVQRPEIIVAVVGSDLTAVPELSAAGFVVQFCAPIEATQAARLTGGAAYLRVVHLSPDDAFSIDRSCDSLEMPSFDVAHPQRLGGSGRAFAWERIADCAARYPSVVAGGLDARNVGDCIRRIRPAAVDVRSGIECRGRKSKREMCDFVRAVREADRVAYAA